MLVNPILRKIECALSTSSAPSIRFTSICFTRISIPKIRIPMVFS
jgi:hypothetical protein